MNLSGEGYKFCSCKCHNNKDHYVKTEEEIKSLQTAVCHIRRDMRQIIHDEILRVLDHRARRTMPL